MLASKFGPDGKFGSLGMLLVDQNQRGKGIGEIGRKLRFSSSPQREQINFNFANFALMPFVRNNERTNFLRQEEKRLLIGECVIEY